MPRSQTSSFITEIKLAVDSQQERELLARLQAARQLYNACLGEAMKRLDLVRNSEAYQTAKNLSKDQKKKRSDLFSQARKECRYSEYDLQAYSTIVSKQSKWISAKVDSNTQQTLASRAFRATERVLVGVARKVRFKVASRFRSVEGKTNKQGIRWKDNQVIWCSLTIKPLIDGENPVIQHGLNSRVKYVRLLWRELNGKRRWFVQLINEGLPYQKPQNQVGDGVVGIDINLYNIAFVSDTHADLLPFADKVPTFERQITACQQKMQRSQRATNPDNYHPDSEGKRGRKTVKKKGKAKKGKQRWYQSNRYKQVSQKKRELERKKAAYAKSQNRKLVNEILRHGRHIKTENVSIKGWQKRYGKAISAKSPGFVQSELSRKAVSAGGTFVKFSTKTTALSQTHLTGERVKKSLSERVHYDKSGIVMHRDLFSAYLSRFVNEDKLLLQDAINEYPRTEPFLLEAWCDSFRRNK